MAKKRKTRKEKVLSDQRRPDITETRVASPLFTIPTTQSKTTPHQSSPTIGVANYEHLSHDLIKTAILTFALILAELLLSLIIRV
jgi:hypothetical protein